MSDAAVAGGESEGVENNDTRGCLWSLLHHWGTASLPRPRERFMVTLCSPEATELVPQADGFESQDVAESPGVLELSITRLFETRSSCRMGNAINMGGVCDIIAKGEGDEANRKPQLERYASTRRLGPASPSQVKGCRVEWLEEDKGATRDHDSAPESAGGAGHPKSAKLDQSKSNGTHGRGNFTWSGGALAVEVLGARHLTNAQLIGKQDPYLLAAPLPSRAAPAATDFVLAVEPRHDGMHDFQTCSSYGQFR